MSERRAIESGAVWTAADVRDPRGWTDELDADAVAALHAAVRHARRRGVDPTTVTRADFPLGPLEDRVAEWKRDLALGRGFVLVRGFPVADLCRSDVELAYAGLGAHLGTPVSQDAFGTTLGNVVDERVARTGPEVRLYRTNQRQDFHTDGADIVGLLCLHAARRGGESRIVSAAAVFNELLRRDAGLIDTLYEPMPWDRNGEEPPGEPPFYQLPVLSDVDGRPRFFFIGWYIRDSQRHPGAPRLTTEQRSAMDAIESIANDPTFHVEMDFRPGDIQWLNNSVILHAREAYEDDPDPANRRHLLRLWLRAHDFAAVDDALRAGIPNRQ
ncbi:MAG TPA: TauD/TfdA family dioxygenase [Acidimicrobiia bacterium]|nr:TauD/TfdA family dioxygenase [Acidimicrobiia bacterium]